MQVPENVIKPDSIISLRVETLIPRPDRIASPPGMFELRIRKRYAEFPERKAVRSYVRMEGTGYLWLADPTYRYTGDGVMRCQPYLYARSKCAAVIPYDPDSVSLTRTSR